MSGRSLAVALALALAAGCHREARTFPCPRLPSPPTEALERAFARPEAGAVVRRRLVTRTEPPYEIDVASMTAKALPLPDGVEVLDVVTHAGRPWALTKDRELRLRVFERASGSWRERALPEPAVAERWALSAIAATPDTLVVLAGPRLMRLERDRWSTRSIARRRSGKSHYHLLLSGRRLYAGENSGEWGGRLTSIDVDRGEWRTEPMGSAEANDGLPVVAVALDPSGVIWVARAQTHMGALNSALFRGDPDEWTLVASTNGYELFLPGERPSGECGGDWNLPATSFDALAFDAEGRVLLSTGLGVVRRERGGGWTQLTGDWPSSAWPSFVRGDVVGVPGSPAINDVLEPPAVMWSLDEGHAVKTRLSSPP